MSRTPGTTEEHQRHFTENGYATARMASARTTFGFVTLMICEECHYVESFCDHTDTTWNKDGTVLTCDLCGVDGT